MRTRRPRRLISKAKMAKYLQKMPVRTDAERLAVGRAIAIKLSVRSPLRQQAGKPVLECIHRKGATTKVVRLNGNDVLLCAGCIRRHEQGGMMHLTAKAWGEATKAAGAGK